jgi:hypothetical protein
MYLSLLKVHIPHTIYNDDQDFGTRVQTHFHLAGGPGLFGTSAFAFLPGGPFWVPELKLVKLTSIPTLLLGYSSRTTAARFFNSYE